MPRPWAPFQHACMHAAVSATTARQGWDAPGHPFSMHALHAGVHSQCQAQDCKARLEQVHERDEAAEGGAHEGGGGRGGHGRDGEERADVEQRARHQQARQHALVRLHTPGTHSRISTAGSSACSGLAATPETQLQRHQHNTSFLAMPPCCCAGGGSALATQHTRCAQLLACMDQGIRHHRQIRQPHQHAAERALRVQRAHAHDQSNRCRGLNRQRRYECAPARG